MTRLRNAASKAPARRPFGLRDLWRALRWGAAAAGALTVAALAVANDPGRERVRQAVAEFRDSLKPAMRQQASSHQAKEAQRLAETVSSLSTERERLTERIAALERGMYDVTGSITPKVATKPPPVAEPPPAEVASPTVNTPETAVASVARSDPEPERAREPESGPVAEPSQPAASPAQPMAAAVDPVAKTEFGIDIGRAPTIEALRALWSTARSRHGPLLEGLRPVVHMRESNRPGGHEMRLVAGPIRNAATAARLCAALNAAGAVCQPSVFDGRRPALH